MLLDRISILSQQTFIRKPCSQCHPNPGCLQKTVPVSHNRTAVPRHAVRTHVTYFTRALSRANAIAERKHPAGARDVELSHHRLYKPSQTPSAATSTQHNQNNPFARIWIRGHQKQVCCQVCSEPNLTYHQAKLFPPSSMALFFYDNFLIPNCIL